MKTIFLVIFVTTLIVWLGYELVAATNGRPGDTISEIVWGLVRSKPFAATLLVLAIGVLLGHLFWQQNP